MTSLSWLYKMLGSTCLSVELANLFILFCYDVSRGIRGQILLWSHSHSDCVQVSKRKCHTSATSSSCVLNEVVHLACGSLLCIWGSPLSQSLVMSLNFL